VSPVVKAIRAAPIAPITKKAIEKIDFKLLGSFCFSDKPLSLRLAIPRATKKGYPHDPRTKAMSGITFSFKGAMTKIDMMTVHIIKSIAAIIRQDRTINFI
jgi:hypothetical protein